MQDREVVAAIVAGDPGGLAEAYDHYAAPLYSYCRFMLPDPDPMGQAAGAVRDTYIIATSKLEGLRDPDKLRSWLHAVARNECLRRLGVVGGAGTAAGLAGKAEPGAMPEVALPPELREQVLKACADDTPAGRANRVSLAHRAGPFARSGFPQPLIPPGPQWWYQVRRHPRVAGGVAAVAAAVVAGGIVAMLTAGSGSHGSPDTNIALGSVGPAATSGAASSAVSSPAGARSSPSHKAEALGKVTTPTDAPTTGVPATTGHPAPTTPAATSSAPKPSPPPPPPSPSPSPPPSPSPTPSPTPSQTPGTVLAEPKELVLTAVKGQAASGTFDLFAVGGPVHWTITVPAGVVTKVSVSPSAGYLRTAGSWVVVTVTVDSPVSLTTRLVANPGGSVVTIVLTVKA
jgi:hypothetical protein